MLRLNSVLPAAVLMSLLLGGLPSPVGIHAQQSLPDEEPTGDPPRLHLIDTGEGQAVLLDLGKTEVVIDGGEHPWMLRKYLQCRRSCKTA